MTKQSSIAPDFIVKILQMIETQPRIVNWSEDGSELVILDEQNFKQVVLPYFFRHKKMQSFVRQLNMYGFHKVCRSKNSINFKNDNFVKDQPEKQALIKRRKRQIAEQKVENFQNQKELIDTINSRYSFSHPSLPILVTQLINFKNKNVREMHELKKKLDDVGRQINQRKSKKVKPILTSTRQAINTISDLAGHIDSSIEKKKTAVIQENAQKTFSSFAPIIPHPVSFAFFQSQQNLSQHQLNFELNQDKPPVNQNNNANNNTMETTTFNGLGISALCSFNSVTNLMA